MNEILNNILKNHKVRIRDVYGLVTGEQDKVLTSEDFKQNGLNIVVRGSGIPRILFVLECVEMTYNLYNDIERLIDSTDSLKETVTVECYPKFISELNSEMCIGTLEIEQYHDLIKYHNKLADVIARRKTDKTVRWSEAFLKYDLIELRNFSNSILNTTCKHTETEFKISLAHQLTNCAKEFILKDLMLACDTYTKFIQFKFKDDIEAELTKLNIEFCTLETNNRPNKIDVLVMFEKYENRLQYILRKNDITLEDVTSIYEFDCEIKFGICGTVLSEGHYSNTLFECNESYATELFLNVNEKKDSRYIALCDILPNVDGNLGNEFLDWIEDNCTNDEPYRILYIERKNIICDHLDRYIDIYDKFTASINA